MGSKILLMVVVLSLAFLTVEAQQGTLNEAPRFEKYAKVNKEIMEKNNGDNLVVFIGNSITEGWVEINPTFFTDNNYVGRGIGGQTSPQLLLRFRKDVLELNPAVVVINVGTNDIAENTGPYNPEFTMDCIKSMTDLAKANGIKVILSSVLPAGEFPWRKHIRKPADTIQDLNDRIYEFAKANGYAYVDYHSAMKDKNGALMKDLGSDGVHPVAKGYRLMESIVKPLIDIVLSK